VPGWPTVFVPGGGIVKLAGMLLVALAVACQGASDPPKDPVWGKQPCSSCAMLVSDPRFAAQLLTDSGDRLYFDDVGCMAAFFIKRKTKGGQAWVRSNTGAWVQAGLAHFSNGAKTPMDYGFEFSASGSLGWEAVQTAVRQRLEKSES
jgi:hypothetical protein